MLRSWVVRWLQVLLPLAALAILSTLFLLGRSPSHEPAIPYASGDAGREVGTPGMTSPRYTGVTRDGATISLQAEHAVPDGSGGTGQEVALDWRSPGGLAVQLTAGQARLDGEAILLTKDVRMTTSTGYVLTGEDFEADTATGTLNSPVPIEVEAPFGTLTAGAMALRPAENGTHVLDLNGGVRLIYRP